MHPPTTSTSYSNYDSLMGSVAIPGDEADAGVMFDQGAKFANINLAIIEAIANSDETPHWNEDSFFAQ